MPEELVEEILKAVPRRHLPSVIRVSKFFQRLATPLLYRSVELCTVRAAAECCTSLLSSQYNVAANIRAIAVRPQDASCKGGPTEDEAAKLRIALPSAVQRMVRLEAFVCTLPGALTPDMCTALLALPTLKALEIVVAGSTPSPPEPAISPTTPHSALSFSLSTTLRLETIHIRHALSPLTQDQAILLKLAFGSPKLREVVIGANCPSSFLDLLPPYSILDTLTTVTLPAVNNNVLAQLRRMPALKSLAFCPWTLASHKTSIGYYGDDDFNGQPDLALDGLCCSSSMLPSLIPVIGGLQHLRLDGASYLPDALTHAFPWGMQCDDTARTFAQLAKYSDSLRYLAIMIHQPQHFLVTIQTPVFAQLETVVIRVRLFTRTVRALRTHRVALELMIFLQLESTSPYIRQLFSHTPRLKTLLISEDSSAIMMCQSEPLSEQIRIVDEWAKACPTLQTIALSWKHIWSKTQDGWRRDPTPGGYIPAADNVRYAPHRL